MVLLSSWQMDAMLIFLAAIVVYKNVVLKDEKSKGLNFITVAVLFLLMDIAGSIITWSTIGFGYYQLISLSLLIVTFILTIIGSIKIILELLE